jgi:hypothetical protein
MPFRSWPCLHLLNQATIELAQRTNPEGLEDEERNQELKQALEDFMEGTEAPNQARLFE